VDFASPKGLWPDPNWIPEDYLCVA
jgi:hypothetical protein